MSGEETIEKLIHQGILPGMERSFPGDKAFRVEFRLQPILVPTDAEDQSWGARFQRFHETNPHVYDAICAYVRHARANGIKKWSIQAIYEMLRWEVALATKGEEQWKLNNTFRAFYARKMMDEHPEWEGFFELRRLRKKKTESSDG